MLKLTEREQLERWLDANDLEIKNYNQWLRECTEVFGIERCLQLDEVSYRLWEISSR